MGTFVAVDVGGTHIRVAVFSEEGILPLRQDRIQTRVENETPLERVINLVVRLWPEEEKVFGIGIAVPGPVNPKAGVIHKAPNIPGWEDLPLGKIFQDRFKVPVYLGNDANLAAYGEWKFGAGQGHHHVIYLTISTGIGGGVITDDCLVQGTHGMATELGHVTVMPDGPMCSCGLRGHLEAIASGTAIANYVAKEIGRGSQSIIPASPPPTARAVSLAAESGDPLAITAITRAGTYLGHAIADYLHIFDPSIVILGGGVSRSGELLISPLKDAMKQHIMDPEYLNGLIITTASLGDDAGLLGALALARSQGK